MLDTARLRKLFGLRAKSCLRLAFSVPRNWWQGLDSMVPQSLKLFMCKNLGPGDLEWYSHMAATVPTGLLPSYKNV